MISWRRCACSVWPIPLGQSAGRCRRCGYVPDIVHDNQDEPLARRLTEEELSEA